VTALRYTLLSEGSSDRSLLPILTWLVRQNGVPPPIHPEWADLRRLYEPPRRLHERIQTSVQLFPRELLFVHRDADNRPFDERKEEIERAISRAAEEADAQPPAVCVVPVRMLEAWLLFDEGAIRSAAGNPRGRGSLSLPALGTLENLPDPKANLREALRVASGLSPHRRRSLRMEDCRPRITELIDDFSSLRALPAFVTLEQDLKVVIEENCWGGGG